MAKSKYFTAADFKKPKTQTATKSKYFTAADFAKGTEASTTSKSKYFTAGDFAENIANNAINRINALNDNATTLVKGYESRFSGRKGNYEDAYVSDSADYLNTVTQQRDAYKQEYNDILSYLDKNAKYLNSEWVDSVKKSLTENDVASVYDQVVKAAEEDNAYWNSFGDGLSNKILKYATFGQYDAEAAYKTEQRKYGYYQKYQGKSLGELNSVLNNLEESPEKNWLTKYAASVENDYLSKADIGVLEKELEDLKKEKIAYHEEYVKQQEEKEKNKSTWEKIGEYIGGIQDTTLPLAGMNQSSGTGYINPYDKLIAEKEQQIASATYMQGYEGFMDNMDATDYASGSQYVSTRTNVPLDDAKYTVDYGNAGIGTGTEGSDMPNITYDAYRTEKLFGDFLYDYINKNKDALTVASSNDVAYYDYFLGHDKGFLQTMTDEEIGVFNYLYKKNKEDAYAYLDFLESDLQGRRRIQEQEEWAAYAKESPFASSVFSTLISPLKGVSYISQAIDMLDDGKMQENAGYNRFSYIPSAIRSQVSSMIEDSGKWGKVGSFAYNTGMSMADFVWTTGVSGGNQALALGIMGSGAAADTTLAAKDRGLDDGQAFALGTIAGIAETAMENISLSAWLEGDMTEGALRYVLKNALSEGGEEAGTSVINLLADIMIAGDKSEWMTAIQAYIDQGKSPEEAFGLVVAEQAEQIGLDTLGGILSGAAIGGGTYAGTSAVSAFQYKDTAKDKTKAQKLLAEGVELNPDSNYIKKLQGKVNNGKNLTGMQVRNILAANQEQITANDMKKIQQAAEKRLTDLGQTENVSELAEIASKYATGHDLTRAEKKMLTHSQYGSQVAHDLQEDSVAVEMKSGTYGSKAIRSILDKMASASETEAENSTKAFDGARKDNTATYKPLEEKVSNIYPTAESGKATIHDSNETVNLDKVEVVDFVKDKETGKVTDMVLKVDGKDVNASDIDFADDSQSYLYAAVSQIENITPGDAQVIIRNYDPSSGQTVGEYLNGMDEAYTFGYRGYNEAGLEKTDFASKLTDTQMNTAYTLGWSAKNANVENKFEAIKKMRSEAESEKANAKKTAEGKKEKQSKNMTVSYDKGNGEIAEFSKAEMKKLSGAQRAGVAIAKILHKLGLGTNFEFFSSYLSDNIKVKDKKTGELKAARVYVDENGAEVAAPAGVYKKSDGTIRIDLNAYNGKKLTLYAMAHELTHFIQQWSDTKYQALAEFLIKTYDKTDMSMHQRVIIEQARLQEIRGKEVSYDEAFDEVVANAMMKMLDDQNIAKTLAELKAQDANLAQKLISKIKELIDDFINALKEYKQYPYLFDDTKDIMALEKEFEQLKQMWAEALVEASDNFQASLIAKEAGIEIMPVEDGTQYSYSSLAEAAGFESVENEDGTRSFTREGKKVSKVTVEDIDNSPIGAFINFSLEMGDINEADAKRQKKMFADICTMACKTNDFAMTMQFVGSAVFTGMKANADKQYGTTYDFPSICTKTQAVIDAMSAKMVSLGRGLTTDEIVQLYDDVFASGNPVPCPECYVFSRWIGIGGLLDNIKKYQDYYGDMAVEDVAAEYRKMKAEVSKFAEEQGISFGKAKGALTAKLTKEFNKLTEKIEKAENQGEKVKETDRKRLAELEPMMNTVKGMTWLENVYFADSTLKKVNPKFRVPDSVLFDLNNGEAFASQYKDAWAFRTTQGAGYGKAITPYAEARLGEGVLVTNNTTNAIKGKAQGSLDNYFLNQMGKLDKKSREALKRARLKQKIQAFLGGQRFQSTSDARYENASDYLLAALEMQAMGGMVQCYTKVDGAVPAFSAWGFSINQSLMPLDGGLDENGKVKDTPVGGMKPSVAFENRKNHETAGTITIGVNDNHIRAMFKQLVRDFVIPYHASGGKADVVAAFRRIQEGKEAKGKAVRSTDYSRTQSDKVLSDEVLRWQGKTDAQIQRIHEIRNDRIAILTGGKPNMTVVRSNRFLSTLYDKFNGGEWDGVKVAKSKVESQIFPNEFWDQTVTYEESAKITKDYLEYCEDLGFLHRFSGTIPSNGKLVPVNGYNENGERVQLTDLAYKYDADGNKTTEVEEFFWKVLTDRRMYDNNGKYQAQKVVTLNDTTTDTVTGFAKNNQGREYDKAKAEALAQKIVKGDQYSSQETDADVKAEEVKYPPAGEILATQKSLFSWEFLTSLDDMNTVTLPEVGVVLDKETGINQGNIVSLGMKNAKKVGETIDGKVYVTNRYTHRKLRVDTESIRHGLDGKFQRLLTNSRMGAVIGDIVQNAVPINGRTNTAAGVLGTYSMGAYATDSKGREFICIVTVEEYGDSISSIEYYDVTHALNGRQKRTKKDSQADTKSQGINPIKAVTISIEDFLGVVKNTHQSLLSDSVLEHYGEERDPNGDFTGTVLFSSQETDADYLDAVNRGDMETAQKMVDEASKAAEYDTRMFHETDADNIHIFDISRGDHGGTDYETPYGIFTKSSRKNIGLGSKQMELLVKARNTLMVENRDDVLNKIPGFAKYYDQIQAIDKKYDAISNRLEDEELDALQEWMEEHPDVDMDEVFPLEYIAEGKPADIDYPKYLEAHEKYMKNRNEWESAYAAVAVKAKRFITDYLRSKGYDSMYFKVDGGSRGRQTDSLIVLDKNQVKSADPVTYDDNGNVIPLSERFNKDNDDIRYSTQETDIDSNRAMLANAFEGLSQNSEEYKMIQKYKGRIKILNEYEDRLAKVNAEIYDMTFGKDGERDSKKLKQLRAEAKDLAEHISRNDKILLNMEASEPLRKVIEQERKKASQKTKEHLKQIVQNKKARAEQTEIRHKIRKTVRDLDKLLNRGNKKTNVKEDMKDFVSKALELADYLFTDHISNDDLIRKGVTVRMTDKEAALVKETEDILSKLYDNADSLTDEEFARLDAKRKANEDKLRDLLTAQRNERLNTPVAKLFDDLVKSYAILKNSKQDAVKAAYSEELENSLRAMTSEDSKVKILENMRVADMTTEELNWLYRAYTMVLTNVRNANKAFANSGAATIEEISNKVYRDFSSRKIPEGKLAIAMQKLTNKIGWDYEKLYYALDRIGSEAFTELIMNLANSENIVMQDVIEAIEFRDKVVKEYGFNNWAVNKEIDKEFLDNTGKKFKLTLGQLMALYAYSRRDGAWDHIEYGGFVFGEASLTNPKPADAYKLTKAQCEAITDTLTKEQKAYVRDMQKYLSETMGEKGNEVSMLLYGIKMFGEENYFPIHIAGQFKTQANESQAKAAAGFSTMSNAGFTHAQNPNAKAPFVLEGFNEIWVDHVNEMSRYHGTVPALEDIRRVMNRSSYSDAAGESVSIRQQMENSFGKEAVEYFDNLYREANSGAITDKLQRVPKKLLSLFRKNSVAYSLSVIIQQPSAMVRAYAVIDKKYFGFKGVGALTSGVAKAVSSKWNPAYANSYNEMLKYAPGVTMAKEIGGFDTHTGASIREYLLDTGKSFKQSVKTENLKGKGKAVLGLVDDNAIANLPNVADKIAWIEIWNACKRETVAKHKDLATNSEEFMQIVGERFTEVIRATQVYDSIFAKSPMLKSKSLAVQYLVSFMNEPNTTINMVEKSIRDATKGDWKGGLRIAAAVTGSIIFNNVLKGIIYAMRDDDEDETYIEKYLVAVTGGMMDDFNPINYIPIARDVWSKVKGFDVERPDVAIISDAIDAYQAIAKYKGKDTEDMTEEEIAELDKNITDASWKLAGSLATFFGIPVKNIYREIDAVIDHARIASANAGMTTASGVWDKVKEEIIDSIPFMSAKEAKTDKLYDAIIGGDKTYLERLKSTYKTEDAYHSAVRKALRENDTRIHEAALARYSGKIEEYKRIFREIQKEGKFSFDDIMGAVNSEVSAIENKLEPDKETSQYSAGDFVEAVAMGNTINAEAMRDDIIATKVANGKTQEEAEKEFASNVGTDIGKAYSSGLLDDAQAEKLLVEYAGNDEEEAASRVNYWAFCEEHEEYKDVLSESNVNDYQEFAEPAEISLDVYAQFITGTKGLETIKDEWGDVEVSKRDQVLEVIDALALTRKQKDALYLAAGYSESKIWDVPW